MDTVQDMMASRQKADSGGQPAPGAAKEAPKSGLTSGQLQAIRGGTTAVSIFSNFAMDWSKAAGLDAQARDEEFAGRQVYIDAQERATTIHEAYGAVAGAQHAEAAAGGIDIASGSVVEAQRGAQRIADRELTKTRNAADLQAAQRRVRSIRLRQGAKATRATAILSAINDTGSAVASAMAKGGSGGGGG